MLVFLVEKREMSSPWRVGLDALLLLLWACEALQFETSSLSFVPTGISEKLTVGDYKNAHCWSTEDNLAKEKHAIEYANVLSHDLSLVAYCLLTVCPL